MAVMSELIFSTDQFVTSLSVSGVLKPKTHVKSCCPIGQYVNCLAFDWMVNNEWNVITC